MKNYEAVIGLEVHVQLSTQTKIFCSCACRPASGLTVGQQPVNSAVCEVCTGQPGALPALNQKAVEYALRAGLATGARIHPASQFARKNYFYPDLPKGYQISQMELPIAQGGTVYFQLDGKRRSVNLTRIHLEEDAGKSIHSGTQSWVNLNRAGVPLIEVVSEPEIRSAAEASVYLKALHGLVTFLGICEGNLQEGNFRCDVNLSLRPKGQEKFGTRVEIKNVNSFRFVEKAIEVESRRQSELLDADQKIIQETRLYDPDLDETRSMRTKEEAQDYRYFPDPDLPPVRISSEWLSNIQKSQPELPLEKWDRWVGTWGLSEYDASVLLTDASIARFFDQAVLRPELAKNVANLLTQEVLRFLNETQRSLDQCSLAPSALGDLASKVASGSLQASQAKLAVRLSLEKRIEIAQVLKEQGWDQPLDESQFETWVDQVISLSPTQVAEFRSGKEKIMSYLVGQVMKLAQGKANPAKIQEILKRKLS